MEMELDESDEEPLDTFYKTMDIKKLFKLTKQKIGILAS